MNNCKDLSNVLMEKFFLITSSVCVSSSVCVCVSSRWRTVISELLSLCAGERIITHTHTHTLRMERRLFWLLCVLAALGSVTSDGKTRLQLDVFTRWQ